MTREEEDPVIHMYYSRTLKHWEDTFYGPEEFEDVAFYCCHCDETSWDEDTMYEHCRTEHEIGGGVNASSA